MGRLAKQTGYGLLRGPCEAEHIFASDDGMGEWLKMMSQIIIIDSVNGGLWRDLLANVGRGAEDVSGDCR